MEIVSDNNNVTTFKNSWNNIDYLIEILKKNTDLPLVNIKINNFLEGNNLDELLSNALGDIQSIYQNNELSYDNLKVMLEFDINDREQMGKINNVLSQSKMIDKVLVVIKRNNQEIKNNNDKPFANYFKENSFLKYEEGKFKNYIERTNDENNPGYSLEGISYPDITEMYGLMMTNANVVSMIQSLPESIVGNYVLDNIANFKNKEKYYFENSIKQFPQVDDSRIKFVFNTLGKTSAMMDEPIINNELGETKSKKQSKAKKKVLKKDNSQSGIVSIIILPFIIVISMLLAVFIIK